MSLSRVAGASVSRRFRWPTGLRCLATTPSEKPIYVDNQATTPVDERVIAKMLPTFREKFGNAHSRTHAYGWEAEALLEEGRQHVAALINCDPKELVFTSGATEANNLAIKGAAEFYGKALKDAGKTPHMITVQTEHKCVLASAQYLATERGWNVTYLPVQKNGLLDLEDLRNAITPETLLISVMAVNNEIGVIQPIMQIARMAKYTNPNIIVHCDAAQAVGKIPINVRELGVDLMSMSAHKMHGPKGIGALYVRRRRGAQPRVRLVPLIHGGGQENGLRSGTVPVSLAVGFGEAARICAQELPQHLDHVKKLADRFLEKLRAELPAIHLNGDAEARYPGNCNVSFDGVEGESLIMSLKDVAVSSGSACTSASLEPSYVLRALGVNEELAHTSIRFAFSNENTEEEIDFIAEKVISAVRKLREMSPLWEMRNQTDKTQGGMKWT